MAGLRIGLDENGKFAAFLTREEMNNNRLDLFVAGSENGVMMVEAGANEIDEDTVAEAIAWAHQQIQPAIELQKKLRDALAPVAQEYELVKPDPEIQ